MKKIFFIFSLLIILSSCSKNEENSNNEISFKQPKLNEIKFIKINDNSSFNQKNSTGKIIIIDIARKKHSDDPNICGDCKCGLGVCRVCLFCDKNSNSQEVEIYEENGNTFFELKLAEPKKQDIDYTFYVDENVYADDIQNLYVVKGIYNFNPNIGLYGGYKIDVKIN